MSGEVGIETVPLAVPPLPIVNSAGRFLRPGPSRDGCRGAKANVSEKCLVRPIPGSMVSVSVRD